ILEKFYGMQIEHPDVMRSRSMDALTGTVNFYKPDIVTDFVEIRALKTPKPLSEIDLSPLNQNFFDANFWLTNFPPDTFEFSGLTVYRMIDVTDREMISNLEYSLLHSHSIISDEGLMDIQEKLRNYFKVPDLRLGLFAMSKTGGKMEDCGKEYSKCFIPIEKVKTILENFEHSIYAKAMQLRGPFLVDDLSAISPS